jgi:CDP-paratose 2-epimerase
MTVAVVTGSSGLVGAETVRFLQHRCFDVVGIDNDMRKHFFGDDASTLWRRRSNERFSNYVHKDLDIRDLNGLRSVFKHYGNRIGLVVHTAGQPSHDWAARYPLVDFEINATGTLNLLELTRTVCPDAVFIFTSTNKVYGDTPNRLPLIELETRFEIGQKHKYAGGIDETMSIDNTLHSVFGASKVAADIMVQEYGRYYDIKTVVFRSGCITGSGHSGAELHGFLNHLIKCAIAAIPYTVFGYKGKQVRDNIHVTDLVQAFWHYFQKPRFAEVYNIGGGRASNCSVVEAIAAAERITGRKLSYTYDDNARIGDHRWWISDLSKFRSHYPDWRLTFGIDEIVGEIANGLVWRLSKPHPT